MKMTLNTKILTGFLACSLVLVVVASISFTNSEKFLATNRWVNHTHEVLEELDQVLLSTVNTETGARGFTLTGEPHISSLTMQAGKKLNYTFERLKTSRPTIPFNREILIRSDL